MSAKISDELAGIDVGDKRLNARSKSLIETLFADPAASINAACQGWGETQATYRFLDNAEVTPEAILAPHRAATLRRIGEHSVVLIAQDSTELDYSDHPPEGAGPLNSLKQRGFMDHCHIAFTPGGLNLGMIENQIWARSDEGFGTSKQRQHDPLETKEKYRWLEGYRHACQVQREVPGTQIVSVSDCEGDIYEVFAEFAEQGEGRADYVIRSGKPRCLTEVDSNDSATHLKLQEKVSAAPVLTVRELKLRRTPKREPRHATLEIRATCVQLKAPYRKHKKLPDMRVNVVLVREMNPPSEDEVIEWLLLTSLPIDTPHQALQVVDYYTGRWPIECFFRIYKTGCQVERIQLETKERLMRCLMLYRIIAWRVAYLTMLGRECPQLPCDVLFTAEEWKPVWKVTRRKDPLPKSAPPLSEFLLMLAELGGHNGRTCDGTPGSQSLWVGIRRMTDFALAWIAFGPDPPAKSAAREKTGDTCV